tara:strand:- start:908 stop:1408 length:501 start_codon:yes stop_codon:yes gene_type:complete
MNLYIQTQNGQPVNHPALENNLLEAFGQIPTDWEPFVRVVRPTPGVYEVLDSEVSVYSKVNGVWTDVWALRAMTDAEKVEKQQFVQGLYSALPNAENWSAWTLDVDTCEMVPPIPRPEQDQIKLASGVHTVWCGADNNWKDTPAHPLDGNEYIFDHSIWQWVEFTP